MEDELTSRRVIKSLLTQVGKLSERHPRATIMLAMWNILSALAEEVAQGIPLDAPVTKISFQEIGPSEGVPVEWVQGVLHQFLGRRAWVQAFADGSNTVICVSDRRLTQQAAWVEWERYLNLKEEE